MEPGQQEYRGRARFDDDAWHLERAQRLRMTLFDMHKPSIARVHGRCLAGGIDLALLCDLVICSDDAIFGFPPARYLGTLPNNFWLYHVGPQWAKRLLLTGDSISGIEAAQIGLVLKSVPLKHLTNECEQLADRLSLIDPDLLAVNKRVVNLGLELMGARTLQRLAAENDVRGHHTRAARTWLRSAAETPLQDLFRNTNRPFGDGRARVLGPELRDPDGKLLDQWD
jgi:enoyl-CoA hydratase